MERKSFTQYDKEVIQNLEVETVRTVESKKFKDFPYEKFPLFYRSGFGKSDQRLYARKGSLEFYSGITGAIGRSGIIDMSGLNKARVSLAADGIDADLKWRERAEYGSCFHLIVALHERGELEFTFGDGDWIQVVDDFINDNHYYAFRSKWIEDIQNDMAAWFSFKAESEVEVITTEVMAYSDTWRIATPLDIICTMKFNRKKITANVNLKTGDTHPFSDSYYLQTAMEAYLYNQQIGESKYRLEGSFAWRPKTRATTPAKYELSKNTINEFGEEYFRQVGNACLLAKPKPLYKASGSITSFVGNEKEFFVKTISAYEWLAQLNDVDPKTLQNNF